jgi:hypothetical protein
MKAVEINDIASISYPYTIYVCDVFANQCVLLSIINSPIPPSYVFTLPLQFQTAPAIGLKIITSDGCERFEILYCNNLECGLLLQNGDFILLQGGDILLHQNC